ncbi:Orotate phosphoribosyltransferase [Indibacter alkaliphilus LW1]|uniref:Orotate phosphoribosyltransferase n=1 Tax=Indibacter alkaliphilus (strain CCUG 57479 / KCTC 22604 / LW1) TaxID=1189612 RepID=S2D191_INDAL|nr:orotate phosphoribosyltransferase [Indibacter alkaliphilus]EOZ92634.1 Orotate phosphoribosyltransferase [Indibacter alkaliphilus LW1]
MELFDKKLASEIASLLLEIKAIQLQPEKPFTWASGWKSPIYCDNRISLSFPEVRTFIKKSLVKAIQANFPEVQSIAGVATAGIPQGALIADQMELPFLYVRSKPKGHGMENMIEGKVTPGQKVVVVEDLVSTGGSSLKAVKDLKAAGFEVLGMVSIFTYGFDIATLNFQNAGVKLICLSDYSSMLPQALGDDYIDDLTLASLVEWRKDPSAWKGVRAR